MACRNVEKANEAADEIRKECQNVPNTGELVTTKLDLSSLKSVRTCADHLNKTESKINLLINNAGVMLCPETRTEDGYELQFATNHLGHYLFTLLLLPKIIKSAPSRIVNVSSMAHESKSNIFLLTFNSCKLFGLSFVRYHTLSTSLFPVVLVLNLKAALYGFLILLLI